ncbi:3743_t:CDS:1, partial [Acaulospora morrowiae]
CSSRGLAFLMSPSMVEGVDDLSVVVSLTSSAQEVRLEESWGLVGSDWLGCVFCSSISISVCCATMLVSVLGVTVSCF